MTPLVLGVAFGHTRYGAFAALGALPAGLVAAFGRGSHSVNRVNRVNSVLLCTAGATVGAFVGSAVAAHAWILAAAVALFAYTAGLLGAFGPHVGVAAVQWPLALLMATSTPGTPREALARAACVLAGGAWQAALTALADRTDGPSDRAPVRTAREHVRHLATHARLRSPHGRHALRLAGVAAAAQTVALSIGLSHAYWAALTAVAVLKGDHGDTMRRGAERIGGTLCGLLLGAALIALGTLGTAPLLLGTCVTLAIAYQAFPGDYLRYTFFLTGFVAALLDLTGQGTTTAALARMLATLIGGALALAASHLRPDDERGT